MSYYGSSTNFANHIKMGNYKDQPLDTVHSIVFNPFRINERGFGTACWDGFFRYYEIPPKNNQEIELMVLHFVEHPVLTVDFGPNNIAFLGLATGQIFALDMANKQNCMLIGGHEGPILKVFWIQKFQLMCSLSFDDSIRFWTLQAPSNNSGNLAKEFKFPVKIVTAAYMHPYLLVGTADNKLGIMNMDSLPNLNIPNSSGLFQVIEIGSKYNASWVDTKQMKYAVGCADGRLAVGEFTESYSGISIKAPSIFSRSNKRESSYNRYSNYGQVNDISLSSYNGRAFLILAGTQELSLYNLVGKDKCKKVKGKMSVGRISLDQSVIVFAEGNDWNEGIYDLKKNTKPKISAVRLTKSELESCVAMKNS